MKKFHLLTCVVMFLFATNIGAAEPEDEGQWITFLSRRSGENLLYKMRPDGREVTPIFGGELEGTPGVPEGAVFYREPHFGFQSPDGNYFLDAALDRLLPPGRSASADFLLHLGRLDGGPTRVVAVDAGEDFAWAPDSKHFLYGRSYQQRLLTGRMTYTPRQFVIASLDGTHEEIVLEKTILWGCVDWSQDGKKILFSVGSTLDVTQSIGRLVEFDLESARAMREAMPYFLTEENLDAIDSNLRTLATAEANGMTFGGGAYSPDGKTIATFRYDYNAPDEANGNAELVVLDVEAGTLTGVVSYPEGLRGPVRWSPDGEEILFCRHLPEYDEFEHMSEGEESLGIWAIRPDGSGARFITTGWCADWR